MLFSVRMWVVLKRTDCGCWPCELSNCEAVETTECVPDAWERRRRPWRSQICAWRAQCTVHTDTAGRVFLSQGGGVIMFVPRFEQPVRV